MSLRTPLMRATLWIGAFGLAIGLAVAAGIYLYLSPKLPPVESLKDVRLQVPLRIYSRDGVLIGEFGEKRRIPVLYDEVPQDFIHAILAAEDDNFWEHNGIDLKGLMRAAWQLATTGHIHSGGSTITMQVARNYLLTRKQTFTRKFTEILLALRIDRELSKRDIMELYINKIYLGNRAYGIGAAAQVYYGKSIDQLDLAQLAMIAGLPKAPSANNPLASPHRAVDRRNWILGRMRKLGYIGGREYRIAVSEPISASYHGTRLGVDSPYIAEMARRYMLQHYGPAAYVDGYEVYTTVDSRLQKAARKAVRNGLLAYDHRHGWRGPEHHWPSDSDPPAPATLGQWREQLAQIPDLGGLEPAVIVAVDADHAEAMTADGTRVRLDHDHGLDGLRLYRTVDVTTDLPDDVSKLLNVGDVVRLEHDSDQWQLSEVPAAQAALVSLSPHDGGILALVGGFDFHQSKFNRVLQARRQPGSNFKPFLYSAALHFGFTPASIINDAPVVFNDSHLENTWRPVNAGGRFFGPMRLRKALYLSRNLVSIRLLRSIGVDRAIDYVKRFGFDPDKLPHNLSLALGSQSSTPMQIVTAYAVLANGGYRVNPYLIDRVVDVNGKTVFQQNPARACRDNCEQQTDDSGKAEEPDNKQMVISKVQVAPQIAEQDLMNGETSGSTATGTNASSAPAKPEPKRAEQIMDPRIAYQIDSILQDVIRRGTGTRARSLHRSDIAGKTGTTNGPTDAWFSGYNPDIVATAWVGFDQNQLLGRHEYGGSAALPIWIQYMGTALKGRPEEPRKRPDGLVTVRIDPANGLLAYPGEDDAIFETFREEDVPKQTAQTPDESGKDDSGKSGAISQQDLF